MSLCRQTALTAHHSPILLSAVLGHAVLVLVMTSRSQCHMPSVKQLAEPLYGV